MKTLLFILVLYSFSTTTFAENVSVVLKVKFKSGDINVQPEQNYVISNLHSVVTEFPESRIYVLGHTDSLGSDKINQELSEARAKSIYTKLIEQGANNSKISVKGMGESAPIADNKTRLGREKNRRVVVTFTQLSAEKVKALKGRLATTKGMTILAKESLVVDSFINKKNQEAIKAEQERLAVEKLAAASAVGTAAMVSTTADDTKNYRYSIAGGAYYNVLEAKDRNNSNATAEWVSELNATVGGAFQYKVSQFWFGAKIFGHVQDYEIERSPNFTWDEETPFLIRGSLISDYETKRWGLGLDLDFNEESSIFENGGNVRLVDELFIGVTARAKYKWLNNRDWSSRVGAVLSHPLSASSDIDSEGELGYIVELDLRRENVFKGHGLTAKLYYGFRNLSNQQNDQDEEVLGLMLSLDSSMWF